MLKYLFKSAILTLILFFASCQSDPYPKRDTNILVVTANGTTTRSNVSIGFSGEFDPYGYANASGSPYSAQFYIPGSSAITMSITGPTGNTWYQANGQTLNATFNYGSLFESRSITASFTNLMFVAQYPTGSPTDTIYASGDIFGKK